MSEPDYKARYPWALRARRHTPLEKAALAAALGHELFERETWGEGAWQDEPDLVEWREQESGYLCRIRRAEVTGALCGYSNVPEGHPFFGKDWRQLEIHIEAHGGLTYAGPECSFGAEQDEPSWWFGFDCAHAFDLMPGLDACLRAVRKPAKWAHFAAQGVEPPMDEFRGLGGHYWALDEVRVETDELARQLQRADHPDMREAIAALRARGVTSPQGSQS